MNNPDEWEDCPSCGGEGYIALYDEDPLWYDPDDIAVCSSCNGSGNNRPPLTTADPRPTHCEGTK